MSREYLRDRPPPLILLHPRRGRPSRPSSSSGLMIHSVSARHRSVQRHPHCLPNGSIPRQCPTPLTVMLEFRTGHRAAHHLTGTGSTLRVVVTVGSGGHSTLLLPLPETVEGENRDRRWSRESDSWAVPTGIHPSEVWKRHGSSGSRQSRLERCSRARSSHRTRRSGGYLLPRQNTL